MFGFLAFSLLFTGCPEPVGTGDMKTGGVDKDVALAQGAGSMPTDPSGDAVRPHAMGTCSGDGPDTEMSPKFSQSSLQSGGVISGYVKCDKCSGQILINVMNPPPTNQEEATPDQNRLITQKIIDNPGSFSIRVPDKTRVQLQVVDDANKDGLCSQGESFGIRGSGPIYVDGTAENIELTVGVFPQKDMTGSMNNPDQNAPATPTTVPSEPPSQNVDTPDAPTQAAEASPGDGPPPDDK